MTGHECHASASVPTRREADPRSKPQRTARRQKRRPPDRDGYSESKPAIESKRSAFHHEVFAVARPALRPPASLLVEPARTNEAAITFAGVLRVSIHRQEPAKRGR